MLRAAAFVAHSSRPLRRGGTAYVTTRLSQRSLLYVSHDEWRIARLARARTHKYLSAPNTQGKLSGTRPLLIPRCGNIYYRAAPCHQSTCRHIYIQLGEVKVVQTYGLRRLSILIFVRGVRMDVSAWPRFTLYKVKYSVWKKGEPVALSKRRSRNPVKLSTNPPFYRSSR